MPQASNIVLADALATPVNHTFIPIGKDPQDIYWFEDQSRPTPIGFWRIGVSTKRPPVASNGQASNADRVYRVKATLAFPTLETIGTNDNGITPPPTVAYVERASVEFILPERGLVQERKDLRKMTRDLIADPQIISLVESLQTLQG
jgi:hypothetical protein